MLESGVVLDVLRHLRSVLYTIPLCLLATALLICGGLLTATEDGARAQRALFKCWAQWILWICRLRVRAHGVADLEPDGAYVFASNHTSILDAPILIAAIPNDLCFLVTCRFIPVLELFLRRTGQIGIRRNNATQESRSLEEAADAFSNESRSLVVFPEGHRSAMCRAPFRDDAAHLAISSARPLVPVRVEGVRAALPGKSTLIIGGTVDVYVGSPTPTRGLDARTATNKLRDQIAALAHLH